MNYDLFKRLVKGKEKATVDFKIQCGALESVKRLEPLHRAFKGEL